MDKYMKFIFTIIAVGIIGINFQLFSGNIITKANASLNKDIQKVQICDLFSCSSLNNSRLVVAVTDY